MAKVFANPLALSRACFFRFEGDSRNCNRNIDAAQ
jgi:hypothetical protein